LSTGVALKGASTAEEIARILKEHCAKLPPGIPVIAHGFVFEDYEAWSLADLAEIDEVTGDRKTGGIRTRHTLYHLGFVTDDQITRMNRLKDHIIAGVQPSLHWEYSRDITRSFYGSMAIGSYPCKKMKDAGVTLAFSTDFASNLMDLCWPTVIMKVALTGGGDPVANPPLTMHDLIEGFTVGGYATTREKNVGTLDVGCKADILVYSKDLYAVPAAELGKNNPSVLATYVGGKLAYAGQF
jgi:hypothetical protein